MIGSSRLRRAFPKVGDMIFRSGDIDQTKDFNSFEVHLTLISWFNVTQPNRTQPNFAKLKFTLPNFTQRNLNQPNFILTNLSQPKFIQPIT